MDELNETYDVLVIGGGAAGLSGALTLARARWQVAVIDAGEPRNAPAEGVHGLLGREGVAPADLLATGREEVRAVGGSIVAGRVDRVVRHDSVHPFEVTLDDGRSARARRLLVTTGLVDTLPAIPGLAERFGRDVIHCPFCHGWEHRDQRIGVLATGPHAARHAQLFSQWSPSVTLLTPEPLDADAAARMSARGVEVVVGDVARTEVVDDALRGVVLADGTRVALDAIAVGTSMAIRQVPGLDLQLADHPSGMGQHVVVDATGRTSEPGVWAAGNVSNLAGQVATAAAEGVWAGAQLTFDLVEEATVSALQPAAPTS